MANRTFTDTQALEKEVKFLAGTIALSSGAAVGTVDILGVASVVKTGTGTYRITLQDRYPKLLFANVRKLEAAASNAVPELKAQAVNSATPTIDFTTTVYDGSAAVEDIGAAMTVYVELVLKNSTVGD